MWALGQPDSPGLKDKQKRQGVKDRVTLRASSETSQGLCCIQGLLKVHQIQRALLESRRFHNKLQSAVIHMRFTHLFHRLLI